MGPLVARSRGGVGSVVGGLRLVRVQMMGGWIWGLGWGGGLGGLREMIGRR